LAVHGLAHSGSTFELLANDLFKKTGSDKIDCVLALNFPGRNGSGLPSNLQFGNLTVEDYTAVLLGVLDQLAKQITIESIVGHSMVDSLSKRRKTTLGLLALPSKKNMESRMCICLLLLSQIHFHGYLLTQGKLIPAWALQSRISSQCL